MGSAQNTGGSDTETEVHDRVMQDVRTALADLDLMGELSILTILLGTRLAAGARGRAAQAQRQIFADAVSILRAIYNEGVAR